MKSLTSTKTLNSENVWGRSAQRSTPKLQRRVIAILGALLLTFGSHDLRAQVGNDNPTGWSGNFNGLAGGCGYDPYTANATRSITDISVAGAVGEYPLALVRTANSRTPSTTEVFGWVGGWNHNYNWILEDSPHRNNTNYPTRYTVVFPDGRVEKFRAVTWDTTCFRVRPGNDDPSAASSGVRERLVPIYQQGNNLYADLILPDGGKVQFLARLRTDAQGKYYYKYHVVAIYDPYGLKTTIDSAMTPNQTRRRITRVTEPGGRYLQFTYATDNGPRIKEIQEFINNVGRRKVQYYYIYNGWLDQVVYYGNSDWTAKYQYTGSNICCDLPLLLRTCDDPMYPGKMKRIAYDYKPETPNNPDGSTPVYGQILSERYYDGTNIGAAVSTLTVGEAPNLTNHRKETRPDNTFRTFIYNGAGPGYLAWISDFSGRSAKQTYDQTTKYIISVMDRNGNTTDYARDRITGNVTEIKFPLTTEDTPGQNTRPTVNYTYRNYYYLHTIQGEAGPTQTTTIDRDASNRVYQITYPDGGWERFPSYNPFNQVLEHRMVTGGTERFTYDGRGLKQTYRSPDNLTGNPTARYKYDPLTDRLTDITDVFGSAVGDVNHTVSFEYNPRGQVTKKWLPVDPQPGGQRHSITYAYNDNGNNKGDGTLVSVTDKLNHITSYTYDDYRRLKSVTTPVRSYGDTGIHTSYFYYGANPWDDANDYKYTDSNVTFVKLPSGKKIKTEYDENRRKWKVTVGYQSGDDATTTYLYDGMGNVTWVTNPRSINTAFYYDERNRQKEVHDVYGNVTKFKYDTAGRKYSIERPNGQVITYEDYDVMNRLKRQRVTQTPDPDAVTKYTYYAPGEGPVGLLKTMQDPHLVAFNNGEAYKYEYDTMGRKKKLTYPLDSANIRRIEQWTYDTAGRLWKFTNRDSKVQTFQYDALNRMKHFDWTNSAAPAVDFVYDAASRLTSINNVNANITRQYYNDNLLYKETEQITGGRSKTVTYTYDADGNRGSTQYPDGGYNFNYTYTGRNQLKTVGSWATYTYDENGYKGDLTTRTLNNGTHTNYAYDALDRVTWVTHSFGRYFNYSYDNASGNRKWTKREDGYGDAFGYDLNDQVKAVFLDVQSPEGVNTDDQTIFYDASGNRTRFEPYDLTETYTINYLNQYPLRNTTEREAPEHPTPTPRPRGTPIPRPTPPGQQAADYDTKGNMTTGFDGSTYQYDAQNRLIQASKPGGPTMYFAYDGLNRQVKRSATGQPDTFSVWDGWNLIEEYQAANNGAMTAMYLYGATGLIAGAADGQVNYYYQDGSGSTSHLTDSNGNVLEWYLYDLQGAPSFFEPNGIQRNPNESAFGVRHLFTAQQWYGEIDLYDLRNRFYSPDIGRFLQPDPIGFNGDRTNLYRYCGNNPVTRWDPFGLHFGSGQKQDLTGPGSTVERVIVEGSDPNDYDRSGTGAPGGGGGGGGGGEPGIGPGGLNNSDNPRDHLLTMFPPPMDIPIPLPPPVPEIPALQDPSTSPATSSGSPTQAQITAGTLQAVVVTFPFGGQYMPMTWVKNSAQARVLERRVFSRVPIFVPPGQNPQATINRWAGTTYPVNLPSFGVAFRFKGPNDFAYNVSPIYDAYGNFLYGASGQAGGIPASVLQGMGHATHGGLNYPINVHDIQLGIDAAMMAGMISVVPVSDSDF